MREPNVDVASPGMVEDVRGVALEEPGMPEDAGPELEETTRELGPAENSSDDESDEDCDDGAVETKVGAGSSSCGG